MKVKEILNMSYEWDRDIFQRKLRGIKPFREIPLKEEISLEKLERYIGLVQRKYALQIDYICPTFIPEEENVYSATVRKTTTNEYLTDVYGKSIYELFVKISILYYALTKTGKNFPLADWEGQKEKRAKRLKRIMEDEKWQ